MISSSAIAKLAILVFAIPSFSQSPKVKGQPQAMPTRTKPLKNKITEVESPSSLPNKKESGLTWDECVREMAQNNAELRSFVSTLKANAENVKGARAGFFPTLAANLGYTQSDTSTNSSTTSTTTGSGATISTALNLTQNLFNGLSDYEKIEAAKRQVRIAELHLQNAKAKALLELRTAYVAFVHSKKMSELSDYIIRRRDDNLKMVELRFESGRENKGALLLSRAYLESAKFEKFQSANGQRVASEQLAKAMGREVGSTVEVSSEIPAEPLGLEPSVERLSLHVPDYQISQTQEEVAQITLRQTRSGFLPTLNLTGSVFGSGGDLQSQSNHWSVGLALTLPIFNGGKDYYSNSSAFYSLQTAMFNQHNVSRQTIVKLRQAYVAWVEAAEQSRINLSYLNAHKVRATISRDKYNNGLLTFDQWDAVENDLIKIEKDYLNGLKTHWVAEATWKQVQGLSEAALDEALK